MQIIKSSDCRNIWILSATRTLQILYNQNQNNIIKIKVVCGGCYISTNNITCIYAVWLFT